jgi:probable phosphoglycerate mutase
LPTLYLVRHGQTDWNVEGRLQGHADRPLNANGRAQAASIAERLATVPLAGIYASDLDRTMTTAREIASYHALSVTAEPRLREYSYGVWEGRRMSDLARLYPDAMDAWHEDPPSYVPAGAESPEAVSQRIGGLLAELRSRPASEAFVLVSHGRTLRSLLALLSPQGAGCPPRRVVDTASLSRVELHPDRAEILLYNDTTHLEGIIERAPVSGGA